MSMELMRDNIQDDYGFLELQNEILSIMKHIDNVCKLYEIDYCLMGGSALGAKRHKGFIPWDDDLDIFMTPANFNKFRECLINCGSSETYYLQEWGKCDEMVTLAKIRKNDTKYIESCFEGWDIHQGIFVDIFILHSCPAYTIPRAWQFIWAKFLVIKGLSLRDNNRYSGIKNCIVKCFKIIPRDFLLRFSLKQVYRYQNKETQHYCNFLGKAGFKKGMYKREWFTPTEYIDFEKVKLKVPSNLDAFLTERFANYMEIPSQKEIKWNQHASFWSLNDNTFHDENSVYKDECNLI